MNTEDEDKTGGVQSPLDESACSTSLDVKKFFEWLTTGAKSPESREDHRNQYSDIEWAQKQPEGPPNYKIGDVVEFYVGGVGVIDEVSEPHGGWPSSYSTTKVEGYPDREDNKRAWHYEGDFKRTIAKSPLHFL